MVGKWEQTLNTHTHKDIMYTAYITERRKRVNFPIDFDRPRPLPQPKTDKEQRAKGGTCRKRSVVACDLSMGVWGAVHFESLFNSIWFGSVRFRLVWFRCVCVCVCEHSSNGVHYLQFIRANDTFLSLALFRPYPLFVACARQKRKFSTLT